jgi:hypothetical protein
MRIDAQRVGLLAVPCAGVLIGIIAARDTSVTAAVGAGAALMTGALVTVPRLGIMPTLIWSYFFLSFVDPSKSLVYLRALGFPEVPFLRLFLPVIFGLLSVLLILGASRTLWTALHEPRLTMMTGTCIVLLLSLTLYGLAIATLRGRSFVLALSNPTYILGYLLFFPFTIAIRDWPSWRRLAHGFLVAIAALCIEITVIWLLFAGWGSLPRIYLRGGIFFQVGAIISLSVISAKGEGITKRRRLCFWALGLGSLLGLILSNTRGYFLGFYVSVFVLLCLMRIHEHIRFLKVSTAVFICMLLLGVASTDIQISRYLVGQWGTEQFNVSLDMRKEQLPFLLGRFWQGPIAGMGLGAAGDEAEENVVASSGTQVESGNELNAIVESFIKNIRRPYIYELDHIVRLMQFGVVGYSGWLCFWGLILVQGVMVTRLIPHSYHQALLRGGVAGFVGCLVAATTNPYISSVITTSFSGLLLALTNSAALFIRRDQEARASDAGARPPA